MDFIRSREDRNNLYNNVDLTPRPTSESDTLLSVAMEIEHANNSGYVHGGTIMRLVDTAAGHRRGQARAAPRRHRDDG